MEFDLALDRRGVEQNLVRGDPPADLPAGGGGKRFARGDQPRIRLAGDPLVPLPLLKMAELGQPLVEPPRRAEQPAQNSAAGLCSRRLPPAGDGSIRSLSFELQPARRDVSSAIQKLLNERLLGQPE